MAPVEGSFEPPGGCNSQVNNHQFGTGEMAQQLRALAALLEDQGSIPRTSLMVYGGLTLGALIPFFWPLQAPHDAHRQNTHAHKTNNKEPLV